MILHPLGSRVLIKRKDILMKGNILVPRGSKEMEVCIGEVVNRGPDCSNIDIGDVVTFGRYAPLKIDPRELDYYGVTDLTVERDVTYLLLNEEDILCLVASEKPQEEKEVA